MGMRALLQGRHTQMREVKVKKDELLRVVRENRAKHIEGYKEAVAGYKEAALVAIDKAMQRLKAQVQDLEAGEVLRLAAVSFDLRVPEDHTKDYDQVIRMLEMCVDTEVTLKADEFACYVMDDWEWKNDWLDVSNTYSNKKLR